MEAHERCTVLSDVRRTKPDHVSLNNGRISAISIVAPDGHRSIFPDSTQWGTWIRKSSWLTVQEKTPSCDGNMKGGRRRPSTVTAIIYQLITATGPRKPDMRGVQVVQRSTFTFRIIGRSTKQSTFRGNLVDPFWNANSTYSQDLTNEIGYQSLSEMNVIKEVGQLRRHKDGLSSCFFKYGDSFDSRVDGTPEINLGKKADSQGLAWTGNCTELRRRWEFLLSKSQENQVNSHRIETLCIHYAPPIIWYSGKAYAWVSRQSPIRSRFYWLHYQSTAKRYAQAQLPWTYHLWLSWMESDIRFSRSCSSLVLILNGDYVRENYFTLLFVVNKQSKPSSFSRRSSTTRCGVRHGCSLSLSSSILWLGWIALSPSDTRPKSKLSGFYVSE